MKIYIAGPMTGYENYNRPMFNAVAQQMLSGGHVALNPATLPDGLSQREYMDICGDASLRRRHSHAAWVARVGRCCR